MLQAVYEQYTTKAKEKGLILNLEETTVVACFDMKWTTEAVCNLVDNAIKYTKQGSVSISATAYEMFARIDICDTGIGIAEEEQPKIFSRFYRSENALDSEGVGIGLYLAREIVTSEGGYIKVSPWKEKGTTFSIFLPR